MTRPPTDAEVRRLLELTILSEFDTLTPEEQAEQAALVRRRDKHIVERATLRAALAAGGEEQRS